MWPPLFIINHKDTVVINTIDEHLQKYGLRHFAQEPGYYAWRVRTLSPKQVQDLDNITSLVSRDPSPENIQAFNDFVARERITPIIQSMRADIIKQSGLQVDALLERRPAVLDVGCAAGYLATWYAFSDPRRHVTGVDFSGETIEYAREFAKQLDIKNVHFHSMDITQAVPDGLFDAIVGTHCFESFPDLRQVVGNLVAHLKSDGIMLSITHTPHDLDIAESFQTAGLKVSPIEYFDASHFGETARFSIVIGERL